MKRLLLLLIFLLRISPTFTTMTFRNDAVLESINSNSTGGSKFSFTNSSCPTSEALIDGYLSSGRDKSLGLSSSFLRRFPSLNSFPKDEALMEVQLLDDKHVLTREEVEILRDFKKFLNDLKCPLPLQDHLDESLLIYKMQSNPSLSISNINTEDIFEYILKAMILSLQQNRSDIFKQLTSFFELKFREIGILRNENILFDLIILALFKQEIKITTFLDVLSRFLDFSCAVKGFPIEVEMKKFFEISSKEPKDKEIFEKINLFIEIILKKISNFPIEVIDEETGRSFISIYFKYLCRTGKYFEANRFLLQLPMILKGSKLSLEDSSCMLLVATEYGIVEMFDKILSLSPSDYSAIFSSQLILNRMKNYLIELTPKITEITLTDKFILKPSLVPVILEILLFKANFEEIIVYFISNRLFLQLEMILSTRPSVNIELLCNYLISSSILSSESDYLKLIFTSLSFQNFYLLVSEVFKIILCTNDLDYLVLQSLQKLRGNRLTSWVVDSIVNLSSNGPHHLLNLALESSAKDVIEILCAFYRFEGNSELLRDADAAERGIVFRNDFVQIFDKFNNSFEIFMQ